MEQSLHYRIRERAYEMWNAAGHMDGLADQHWLAAEREVLTEMTAPTSAPETAASHPSRRHTRDRSNSGPQRKRMAKASSPNLQQYVRIESPAHGSGGLSSQRSSGAS